MGAEDFAYMCQQVPGAMFLLGAAIPNDIKRNHHTNIFDIDENVLPIGPLWLPKNRKLFPIANQHKPCPVVRILVRYFGHGLVGGQAGLDGGAGHVVELLLGVAKG